MGAISSWLGQQVCWFLQSFLGVPGAWVVLPQETGIAIWPDRPNLVRKPDALVVRRDRLPGGKLNEGWLAVAPEIVAEVVSPNEPAARLNRKVEDYRQAGIPLIWVIYPDTRTAIEYRGRHTETIPADGALDGGDVLPGFRLPLAELFEAAGGLI
jgi:Uma2 family endonuclease